MPMLGFTVINGHRGPRKVEPQRMSLAERLRRAKSNDGELEIVSARENPSISLDLSDQELGRLMSRMIGGRVTRRSSRTEPKKGGGRKMRGKAKSDFLKRMAAGKRRKARAEGAKSNPRRRRAKHNPRRRAKHNPSHMYAKYNPSRSQVRQAMRAATEREKFQKSVQDYMAQEAATLSELSKGSKPSKPRKPRASKPKAQSKAKSKSGKRGISRKVRAGFRQYMRTKLDAKIAAVSARKPIKNQWVVDARLAALRARRRGYDPKVSKAARNYLKLHGISKVNAGGIGGQLAASGKALVGVLPEVLVAVGSAGVHTYLGSMAGKKLVEKYGASYASWSGSVSSLAIGVLGFLGLRMYGATAKYSVPFLTGGVVGAGVLLLADNHTKGDAKSPSVSWGRALQLPIGSVVLRSEFAGFDPEARHQLTAMGEVLPRGDFKGMGEVITRRDAVAMVGEAEDRALNRLLGEVSQLHADTASGF